MKLLIALIIALGVHSPAVALYDPIDSDTLEQAVRIGNATRLADPPGLWGQPYAPEGLSNCEEMTFYRQQWGLPSAFDGIGWRESNCRQEDGVRTFCCHGYLQLYVSLHLKDHRLAPLYALCGVYSHQDVNSDDPLEKQKHMCAAKMLHETVGSDAWVATR